MRGTLEYSQYLIDASTAMTGVWSERHLILHFEMP